MTTSNTLYLEILVETGGGCEVQFPVACLSLFFGIGRDEERTLTFRFDQPPNVTEKKMNHWDNNTHRVYLSPLRDVERPSVLKLTRTAPNEFHCEVVPPAEYQAVIDGKCTEQTRLNSKRWGVE